MYGYCNGLVLIAPAHMHRFGRKVVLTGRQALGFTLSLIGARQGFAAWVAGECTFDAAAGNTPGPVFVSVLGAGTVGRPPAHPCPHHARCLTSLLGCACGR
jgi:hypothetical protein